MTLICNLNQSLNALELTTTHLEKGNLVLKAGIRWVSCRCRQWEMIIEVARSKISRRLRDNLRTLHSLAVPEGCSILFTRVSKRHESGKYRWRNITIVILIPWASLVSAGFLKSDDSERYSEVALPPCMYHCHGWIWFDHDPIMKEL